MSSRHARMRPEFTCKKDFAQSIDTLVQQRRQLMNAHSQGQPARKALPVIMEEPAKPLHFFTNHADTDGWVHTLLATMLELGCDHGNITHTANNPSVTLEHNGDYLTEIDDIFYCVKVHMDQHHATRPPEIADIAQRPVAGGTAGPARATLNFKTSPKQTTFDDSASLSDQLTRMQQARAAKSD